MKKPILIALGALAALVVSVGAAHATTEKAPVSAEGGGAIYHDCDEDDFDAVLTHFGCPGAWPFRNWTDVYTVCRTGWQRITCTGCDRRVRMLVLR